MVGGRNKAWGNNLVELEWAPNPERDVTGYEVYRVTGGSVNLNNDVKVCSTSVTDANPPRARTPTRRRGQPPLLRRWRSRRPGRPPRAPSAARYPPTPPRCRPTRRTPRRRAPTSITATALTGGGVQLTWTAAIDPDLTPIRYYRIYRDDGSRSTAASTRATPARIVTWTDNSPDASLHKYWVSAVDDHLAESSLVPNGGIQP